MPFSFHVAFIMACLRVNKAVSCTGKEKGFRSLNAYRKPFIPLQKSAWDSVRMGVISDETKTQNLCNLLTKSAAKL